MEQVIIDLVIAGVGIFSVIALIKMDSKLRTASEYIAEVESRNEHLCRLVTKLLPEDETKSSMKVKKAGK